MATKAPASGHVLQLLSELDAVFTPEIANSDPQLTGGWHLEPGAKLQKITLYSNTRDRLTRKQITGNFWQVFEDHILDLSLRGLLVRYESHESGKGYDTGSLDVIIYWIDDNGRERDLKTIRYGIKPAANARDTLYQVTAQECLQVLACAYMQANGSIGVDDFSEYVQYTAIVLSGGAKSDLKKNQLKSKIDQHIDFGLNQSQEIDVYNFGWGNPDWILSSVTTAKTLKPLYAGDYFFCHSGSSHVKWYWTAFQKARDQILNNKQLFKGFSARDLDRNKWNPADMFAMKMDMRNANISFPNIKRKYSASSEISLSDIRKSMRQVGPTKKATVNLAQKIAEKAKSNLTVDDMPSLNNYLYRLSTKKKFYPISLKKVGENATLKRINPGIGIPANMTATLTGVDWANIAKKSIGPTNKIEVHFQIKVGNSTPKNYYIVARQFNANSDIKFQIEMKGGMAFHGKAGLKIGELIINKTDPQMKSKMVGLKKALKTRHPKFKYSSSLFSSVQDVQNSFRVARLALNEYASTLSGGSITEIPQTSTGYLSKIQAAEFGYIIENPSSTQMTSRILYSLYTYAGSMGLVIFDGTDYRNYYGSSFHIKVL